MEILLILGAFQAIFFVVLLLSKKGKTVSDKILALWLSIFAIHLAFVYYSFQLGHVFYIKYGFILSGVIVLYYSLMYVYTQSLVSKEQSFKPKWLLHLLPTVIVYGFIIPLAILPYETKVDIGVHPSADVYSTVVFGIVIVFVTGYIVLILKLLNKHKVTIRNIFSYEENINLIWLKILAFLLIVLWVIISVLIVYFYYLDASQSTMLPEDIMILDMKGQSAFVAFVFFLSFFGIKQQIIYSHPSKEEKDLEEGPKNNSISRYEKSSLKKEDSVIYLKRLLEYMEREKPYLNGKLLLKELADELNISTNHLSQVINENLGKNFFDFVNAYRVDLVKQKMIDPSNKKFTIISLAYECGFNSKSSFNSIFKKHTGLTPSEFSKQE